MTRRAPCYVKLEQVDTQTTFSKKAGFELSPSRHVEPIALARLVKGHVTRAEAAKLVLHLQACEECLFAFQKKYRWDAEDLWSRLLGDLKDFEPPAGRFRRVSQQQHEADARAAKPALARLREIAPEKRHLLVRNTRAFRSLPAVQLLHEETRRQWHRSPARARHWAELALVAVESLPISKYPVPLVADYSARAWSYSGNAKRLSSDFLGAKSDLRLASFWSKLGTQDAQEIARLLRLEASLARDQRLFPMALTKGRQALRLYRKAGAGELAAWLEVGLSITKTKANDYEAVIGDLGNLVDRRAGQRWSSQFECAVHQNLALALVECGPLEAAEHHLCKARLASRAISAPLVEVRLDWLEARLFAKASRRPTAEALFRRVRETFLSEGAAYDAALVSLDLANLFLHEGKAVQARAQLESAIPSFLERGIHREAHEASTLLSRSFLTQEQQRAASLR